MTSKFNINDDERENEHGKEERIGWEGRGGGISNVMDYLSICKRR